MTKKEIAWLTFYSFTIGAISWVLIPLGIIFIDFNSWRPLVLVLPAFAIPISGFIYLYKRYKWWQLVLIYLLPLIAVRLVHWVHPPMIECFFEPLCYPGEYERFINGEATMQEIINDRA